MEEIQEYAREKLLKYNLHLGRPFMAFDIYGTLQFFCVYLDEGDDPSVISVVYVGYDSDLNRRIVKIADSFSAYVDDRVVRRLREERRLYGN